MHFLRSSSQTMRRNNVILSDTYLECNKTAIFSWNSRLWRSRLSRHHQSTEITCCLMLLTIHDHYYIIRFTPLKSTTILLVLMMWLAENIWMTTEGTRCHFTFQSVVRAIQVSKPVIGPNIVCLESQGHAAILSHLAPIKCSSLVRTCSNE